MDVLTGVVVISNHLKKIGVIFIKDFEVQW